PDPNFPQSSSSVGNITVETPRGDIITGTGGIVQVPLNGISDHVGTVTLTAGSRDALGNVLFAGNIDARGSGVIGSTVNLYASGEITGVIFARDTINLFARQNVSVTALSQGTANISSGGAISGTVIGITGVSANATTVDAALLSQSISTSGSVT